MHKEDHLIGVTPLVMRRAAYYLTLGVGEYITEHPHYDKVRVEKLYDVTPNPHNDLEWSMGMIVSFFKQEQRLRWVEFGCRTTGAGGTPIVKEITNE